jgi:hypothetical protein
MFSGSQYPDYTVCVAMLTAYVCIIVISDRSFYLVDQALDIVREQETAKTRLKILENGGDKLVNIVEAIHTEKEDKLKGEFAELNEETLYNKLCVQKMAQILLSFDDPAMS